MILCSSYCSKTRNIIIYQTDNIQCFTSAICKRISCNININAHSAGNSYWIRRFCNKFSGKSNRNRSNSIKLIVITYRCRRNSRNLNNIIRIIINVTNCYITWNMTRCYCNTNNRKSITDSISRTAIHNLNASNSSKSIYRNSCSCMFSSYRSSSSNKFCIVNRSCSSVSISNTTVSNTNRSNSIQSMIV